MSDGGSYTTLGLNIGDDPRVTCHHYDGRTPILVIDVSGVSIQISPKGRDVTESAVKFARALLASVQEFAADIEQLHAERTAPGIDGPAEQAA
jgi:hypothetical protein